MNHLPIDPEEAPWTEEYWEFAEERANLYHQQMMEQEEMHDWECHNCRIPS